VSAGRDQPCNEVIAVHDQVFDDQVQVGKGGQPARQRLPSSVDAERLINRMLDDVSGQGWSSRRWLRRC